MSVRIAVVQMNTVPGAVERNRARALDYAQQALAGGADVILFHEELLVGYHADVRALAEPVDGPTTHAFQALLQGSTARILYGLTERTSDDLYIAATLVGREGVLANYHKTHLWWNAAGLRDEAAIYRPGEALVTFDINGFKSGVMICYDGDFPEMARSYSNLGCEMLFWMNNRESRGYAEVKHLALNNSLIMAVSCCCGPDESGTTCPGGSNIVNYDGALLAELWDQEGILYADVAPERVAAHRRANPWFTGQRGDLYVYASARATGAHDPHRAPAADGNRGYGGDESGARAKRGYGA